LTQTPSKKTKWSADVYPKAAKILLPHSVTLPIQQEKGGQALSTTYVVLKLQIF
jgi:hypothetical protein